MPATKNVEVLEIAGREVTITHPDKIYFPDAGLTKRDLVQHYLAMGEGALRGVRGRPVVLKRFVHGIAEPAFFQKRAPPAKSRPDWIDTVVLRFPSGRSAEEVVLNDLAQLVWTVNLGCVDLNPHPVREDDLHHPDELRVDLDPGPGVPWDDVRRVALEVRALFDEHGLRSWPKTSGSRGMHINVRITRDWSFDDVRRAAIAVAREVERRAPQIATASWWKEERHGVFLDYNQNAKDRTTASVYSVRPREDARVSTPLRWDEVADCEPGDFTVRTMPARLQAVGDVEAELDREAGSLLSLLELADKQVDEGQGDAPWPPHYEKREDEPKRVQPSRARRNGPAQPAKEQSKDATDDAEEGGDEEGGDEEGGDEEGGDEEGGESPTGRRRSRFPLLVVAKAALREEAEAGLARWRERHPEAAALLAVDDVLVDSMRGRSSTWTRIRVNLRHVPEELRPPQEPPDPDYDPFRGWRPPAGGRRGAKAKE